MRRGLRAGEELAFDEVVAACGTRLVGEDAQASAQEPVSDSHRVVLIHPRIRHAVEAPGRPATINRDANSPIMTTGALVLAEGIVGMIEASAMRRPFVRSACAEQEDSGVGAVHQAARDHATRRPCADDHVVVTSGERLAALNLTTMLHHSRSPPLDMLNSLFGRQSSPARAERPLNQVRRPVQAVGGLDARLEPAGPLAVGRVAQDDADRVAEAVNRQPPDRNRPAHARPLDAGPDPRLVVGHRQDDHRDAPRQ